MKPGHSLILLATLCLTVSCDPPENKQKPAPQPGPTPEKSCDIEIFLDANLGSESRRFTTDVDSLSPPFHDQVSSVRVNRGTWRLFADSGFGQPMGDYGPGEHRQLNPNDQLDSMKCLQPS